MIKAIYSLFSNTFVKTRETQEDCRERAVSEMLRSHRCCSPDYHVSLQLHCHLVEKKVNYPQTAAVLIQ